MVDEIINALTRAGHHRAATRGLGPALIGVLGLAAAAPLSAQSQVYESELHKFRLVSVAGGLEHPWSMAFLPNGDMLLTERPGRLSLLRGGKVTPVTVEADLHVRVRGQGGFQEVALHPDFATNNVIYLSYAKANADESLGTTALLRGRLVGDRFTDVEEIFEAKAWGERGGHYAAKIAFDRDGYLFLSVGDRQNPPEGNLKAHAAQDTTNHMGSILRLNDDGSVPADNPFIGRSDVLPEIWSYGHRNPQGLAVHPETGQLWATEHGPQGGDELNVIRPGLNYGWPVIGYGVNYRSGIPIHDSPYQEGMQQPAAFWVPSIGASGLIVYDGDKFPQWRGNIFAGGMAPLHRQLCRVTVDGDRVMTREPLLHGELRIRDVRQSPDGYIYLAVDDRAGGLTEIVRLEPAD